MPTPIEVYVAMNEDGDYVAGNDFGDTVDHLANSHGGLLARVVKLKVTMSPPKVEEDSLTIPDDAGRITTEIAGADQ
jgi:hypothetical protein